MEVLADVLKDKEHFRTSPTTSFPVPNSHYHYLESSFKNIEYEIWKDFVMDARKGSNKLSISLQPGRARHKKSLSDSHNLALEQSEGRQQGLYNLFTAHQPPQEFMQILMDGRQN